VEVALLTARKLLISGSPRTSKKRKISQVRYVYATRFSEFRGHENARCLCHYRVAIARRRMTSGVESYGMSVRRVVALDGKLARDACFELVLTLTASQFW
jgi:hypothetical protein